MTTNQSIAAHLGLPLTVRRWRFTQPGGMYPGGVSVGHPTLKDAEFHRAGMARVYGGACTEPVEYEDDAELPDYANDLNAMRTVLVENVPDEQWDDFIDAMEEFVPLLRPGARRKWVMLAPAEVLARTFLKWKESVSV